MIFRCERVIKVGTLVKSLSQQRELQVLWHYQNYIFSIKKDLYLGNNRYINGLQQEHKKQFKKRQNFLASDHKKDQFQLHPYIDENRFLKKLIQAKDLLDLRNLRYQVFYNSQICLAAFLYKLRKLMNQSSYKEYKMFIDDIWLKLRSVSTELLYDAEQLFEVISFHVRCIEMKKIEKYQLTSFDHKICILVSTRIHNNQYDLIKAVYLFYNIQKLQAASLELLINFIKIVKPKLASKNQIDIQLLIMILKTHHFKCNHILVETILYDVVIQYILANIQIVKSSTFFQRFQLCCTIVSLDSKRFYRSDRRMVKLYLKEQLCLITEKINNRWFNQIFKDQKIIFYLQENINLKQIIILLHALDNSIYDFNDAFEIKTQITAFCDKLWQIFLDQLNQIYSKKNWSVDNIDTVGSSLLVRFMFQRLIYKIWRKDNLIREKVYNLIVKLKFQKQQDLLPLYENLTLDYSDNKNFLEQLFNISLNFCNARIIPWSFMVICLNRMESIKSYKLINSIYLNSNISGKDQQIDQIIPLIMILNHFIDKYRIYVNEEIILSYTNLLQKLISQVFQYYRNEFQLVKSLRKAESQLNNKHFYQEGLIFCVKRFKIFERLNINTSKSQQISNVVTNSDVLYIIYYLACANNPSISYEFTEQLCSLEIQQKYTFNCIVSFNTFNFPQIPYQPNHSLLKNKKTYLINAPKLISNMKQAKFRHLTYQIFLNSYLNKPKKIKQQLFQLLKKTFISMLNREKTHKLVLIYQLSEYIAEGLIVSTKQNLKNFFQMVLNNFFMITQQSVPYNCYLKIIVNGLACNLLSKEMLTKLYNHIKKSYPINATSYVTILYHSYAQDQQPFNQAFQNLNRFLNVIISKKKYHFANYQTFQVHSKSENIFIIDTPIVAIFLRNANHLIYIQNQIIQFLSKILTFKDFLLVSYSISFPNINAEIDRLQKINQTQKSIKLQELKSKICYTLLKKLQFFQLQDRLMSYQYLQIKQKLEIK